MVQHGTLQYSMVKHGKALHALESMGKLGTELTGYSMVQHSTAL
jgi:hypothetical protein